MSTSSWQERPEDPSEPQEAKAPPERTESVFDAVPGEAPTADLGTPGSQPESGSEEPVVPKDEGESEQAEMAAPDPVPAPEPVAAPEPEAAAEPAPEAPEPVAEPVAAPIAPDAETVAGDGHGPGVNSYPSEPDGSSSWWERPEVLLGAAFAGGLLLAALIRRRRS